MLIDVLVGLGVGYALGIFAMARSRDAYGHERMGFLAFIPIANISLLITPSKNEVSANREPTGPLLTGGLGALTGFAFIFASVQLSAFMEVEMNRIVAEAENDPATLQEVIEMMLREQGLE